MSICDPNYSHLIQTGSPILKTKLNWSINKSDMQTEGRCIKVSKFASPEMLYTVEWNALSLALCFLIPLSCNLKKSFFAFSFFCLPLPSALSSLFLTLDSNTAECFLDSSFWSVAASIYPWTPSKNLYTTYVHDLHFAVVQILRTKK